MPPTGAQPPGPPAGPTVNVAGPQVDVMTLVTTYPAMSKKPATVRSKIQIISVQLSKNPTIASPQTRMIVNMKNHRNHRKSKEITDKGSPLQLPLHRARAVIITKQIITAAMKSPRDAGGAAK